MKKPWQTSFGHCIYQTPRGIQVYQNRYYRWLTFNSPAIQTLIHRTRPEKSCLAYVKPLILAVKSERGNSCLLGLGGASIAHHLNDVPLTAVELDPDVIQIARQYFLAGQLKNLSILEYDAALYVQETTQQFQHIIIDLFGADSFPTQCNNKSFLENCQNKLLPSGVLAMNIINLTKQKTLLTYFRECFNQHLVTIPVKGTANTVVLGYKGDLFLKWLQKLPLKKIMWDRQWGYIGKF